MLEVYERVGKMARAAMTSEDWKRLVAKPYGGLSPEGRLLVDSEADRFRSHEGSATPS
jgi:hypothetical protein